MPFMSNLYIAVLYMDKKTGFEIVRLLGRLNVDQRTTIVMVTHDSQMASETGECSSLVTENSLRKRRKASTLRKRSHVPIAEENYQRKPNIVLVAVRNYEQ